MTSEERHEARYQRRKAKREARILARSKELGDFDEVFSFRHLYLSGKKCCKNVMWKNSTQRFMGTLLLEVSEIRKQLMNETFTGKGFIHFVIMERGKLRHIRSVHITERMVQKCLCDYYLVPLYAPSFVYDNGASLKGKGMDFSLQRMVDQLRHHYRKYGRTGGMLFFDFSQYFDSAPHEPLFREAERRMHDPRTQRLSNNFIRAFGSIGLGLGSQVSQTNALMLPNSLDHAIQEKMGVRAYGRYMDDGHLLHEDLKHLDDCRDDIAEVCGKIGLTLSQKKTRTVPLTNSFTYLKTRFIQTETGKVILKMNKRSTKSVRRKMRYFVGWLEDPRKNFTMEDVRSCYESYHGQMKRGNSFKIVQKTDHYFKELFGFYPNEKGWKQYAQNHQERRDPGNGQCSHLGETPGERMLRYLE